MGDIVWFALKALVALGAFVLIMRIGMMILGGLARPQPDVEPGQLRRVNLRYRCSVCAAEVRMTQASEDLPPPPRHCQEEMDLIATPYD